MTGSPPPSPGPGGDISLQLQDNGLASPNVTDGVFSAFIQVFARYTGYHRRALAAICGHGIAVTIKKPLISPKTECRPESSKIIDPRYDVHTIMDDTLVRPSEFKGENRIHRFQGMKKI